METSEFGGGKPHNVDLSSLKPLPEKKELGSGVKKPKIPTTENPSDKGEEKPNPRYRRRFRGVY